MQLSELQTLVNYRRREGVESFVNNTEIIAYINEALREIYRSCDGEFARNYATLTYMDGTNAYTISAVAVDFKSPIGLNYNTSYYMSLVSPEEFLRLSSSNLNVWSIKSGTQFYVSTTFGSANLTLDYYSNYTAQTSGGSWIQAMSASTDSPIIPYEYQDMLVDYAAARCYQKEGLLDDYQVAYGDFKGRLTGLIADMSSYRAKPLRRMRHINEYPFGQLPVGKDNPLNY